MKWIWYISSVVTVILILFNNPNSTSFGSIGSYSQLLSNTRSTQRNILLITIISSLVFVCMTVVIMSNCIK